MSRFVLNDDVPVEAFDWGSAGMRCAPPGTGCTSFVVMDVRLDPGFFHAFHKHPDQDEMITITAGRVMQYIEGESTLLGPGDSVYIDKDVVPGSYNDLRRAGAAQRRARAGCDRRRLRRSRCVLRGALVGAPLSRT